MKLKLKFAFALGALSLASLTSAQVTFYEHDNFRGRTFATGRAVNNFQKYGFNDRASSVIVERGRWEVCDDVRFGGNCVILRRGSYDSLSGMGMNDRISSVRPFNNQRVENQMPEPIVTPVYEYRRRPSERTFQAPVTSVRVVVGPPNERCWLEREQVSSDNNNAVGGTIAGALIGGILGHQVGGGVGKDIATAGGAVAGGMIGNNMGRNSGQTTDREVRRCKTTASTTPEYWDVSYNFRGQEYRTQMTKPPGQTVEVNARGEPRL